ncbi:conserved hypothetical protein [Frankia sp. Hr75.2]|nr:conserved hypothetical protein [Frankia sp. Hr75.2]
MRRRRPVDETGLPAWVTTFAEAEWARPADADWPAETHAWHRTRRWLDARSRWCRESGVDLLVLVPPGLLDDMFREPA